MVNSSNSPSIARQTARNLALWLILVIAFLWAFSFLRSTQELKRPEDLAAKEKKALEIGADYIKTQYGFDIRDRNLLLIDKGAVWDVTYELPKDTIGGAAVVTIDKQSLKILSSYATQ